MGDTTNNASNITNLSAEVIKQVEQQVKDSVTKVQNVVNSEVNKLQENTAVSTTKTETTTNVENTENTMLGNIWESFKSGAGKTGEVLVNVGKDKTTHVIMGNVLMGAATGLVGGMFGPVGAALTTFGYVMGGTAQIATTGYLLNDILEAERSLGEVQGRRDAELEMLRKLQDKFNKE